MKQKSNKVFIATSLDGFIADKNGNIDWLHEIPNPENIDMGYQEFTSKIDALVMGRTTYETVLGFGIEWPYQKSVFVLSTTLTKVPKNLEGKVFFVNGALKGVLEQIHKKGYNKLYIDGGKVIQSFLKEDLIDEIILTRIPVLLGEGSSLFSSLPNKLSFECVKTQIYLDKVVQNHFRRIEN
ncbi:dihydrofolate reductase [Tenacibaculum sp. S7007]|uniref:Dihydrofolate reductase n=1 Tax=Tenacibaculum pelagium TaxID=2759527 RepID=A0A839AMD4_9FLAO|nr:dihydrofolate reductase family protein [Tenacibaculum pelagium]MBA6155339.1 dihydrofolate reductase [Tenacibaculum pelagium]